jgi:L-methionine (R)-S-oxide reductase
VNEDDLTHELTVAAAGHAKRDRRAVLAASAIRRFGGYRWVGIYDVGSEEIGVIGWDGPAGPAHPRFPRSEGLCGAAVAAAEPVVVGDVGADPRYLTTHSTTRSEIVVPVIDGGDVVGIIDVESERREAFGQRDKELLERCAELIVPLWHSA